jgi:hypothetical protein
MRNRASTPHVLSRTSADKRGSYSHGGIVWHEFEPIDVSNTR